MKRGKLDIIILSCFIISYMICAVGLANLIEHPWIFIASGLAVIGFGYLILKLIL